MKNLAIIGSTVLALSACDQTAGWSSFDQTAGSQVDSGTFGNATMNNMMAHTDPQSAMIDLARRFAGEVNSTVNFPFNSTALDETARATLREQANWIRQFPEVRFKVFGHTDLVGSTSYNRKLGLRRAQAVVLYLTSQGIDRSRLEAVVSFGETQPLIVTEGRERQNRRTVTEVAGFVESGRNGPPLNGKYAEVIFREYVDNAVPEVRVEQATGGEE